MAQSSSHIDSFIKYFLDIKPYHTKILEIIERYNFAEEAIITLTESIKTHISIQNKPGCDIPGTEGCDIDAPECCDLFECIGGYGLLFDNSDLLVTAPILSVDSVTDFITVTGDITYDKKFNIKSIPTTNSLLIEGDVQTDLINHNLFLIVNSHNYKILDTTTTSFVIAGNRVTEFVTKGTFGVYGSSVNNGEFNVLQAVYDSGLDQTEVTIVPIKTLTAGITIGYIEIEYISKNNGAYTVNSLSFNGLETEIIINEEFPYIDDASTTFGSIQIRTGMLPTRNIYIENTLTNDDGKHRVMLSTYDYLTDETTIVISGNLLDDVVAIGNIALYGYITDSGFDGDSECTIPGMFTMSVEMSEDLLIEIHPPGWTP